jgi:hypothetical protein
MKKVVVLVAALVLNSSLFGQTIAKWTFETSQPTGTQAAGTWLTNVAPEIGSGSAAGFHSGVSIYTSPAGNGSARSMSSTNWAVGDLYQFATSTLGFQHITVSYDQTSSATGPGLFDFSYSLNGATFTTVSSGYTVLANASPNPVWNATTASPIYTFSYDLSNITALNNAATVYFRLTDSSATSANGGTVGTGGTDRVDNFTVAVVPEPQSAALMIGGLLVGCQVVRRRR